jgi:hypothetical protein
MALEQWRSSLSGITISRLDCSFAFDDLRSAEAYAEAGAPPTERIYEVVPLLDAPTFRADMLWLTWMSEPSVTPESMISFCRGYWTAESTRNRKADANPIWEILLPCGLRVVRRVA